MVDYARPSWSEFLERFRRRWQQGEHVFISAQTGAGKTDIELRLLQLPERRYSVAFISKPQDPILKSTLTRGFVRQKEFAPHAAAKRILLAPPKLGDTREQIALQHHVFREALDKTYHDGGWTIGVDELAWMTSRLKLGPELEGAHYTGRALGLTYVACTQRPKHVPVIVPQSASHAFVGRTGRVDDLRTLAELGGDVLATRAAIGSLRDKHDFVYVDTHGELPLMIVNTHRTVSE